MSLFSSLPIRHFVHHIINPNSNGGQDAPCDAKFYEKCPCLHHNNTALIKQISLFDTALVMTNTLSFNSK